MLKVHLRRSHAEQLSAWQTILTILLSVVVIVLRKKTSAGFLGAALSQTTGLGAALSGFMIRYAGMENGVIVSHDTELRFGDLLQSNPGGTGGP
jgi:O-antigen/teichoic acid export membrane protein